MENKRKSLESICRPTSRKVLKSSTGWSCHGGTVCSGLDTTGGQLNDFIRNQFDLLAIIDHHP